MGLDLMGRGRGGRRNCECVAMRIRDDKKRYGDEDTQQQDQGGGESEPVTSGALEHAMIYRKHRAKNYHAITFYKFGSQVDIRTPIYENHDPNLTLIAKYHASCADICLFMSHLPRGGSSCSLELRSSMACSYMCRRVGPAPPLQCPFPKHLIHIQQDI